MAFIAYTYERNIVGETPPSLLLEVTLLDQSVVNNTSTVEWKYAIYFPRSATISSAFDITIDGVTQSFATETYTINEGLNILKSGTQVISHNTDGTKTIDYSFVETFDSVHPSSTGSLELDKINRPAYITSAPSFDDETYYVTVNYYNPAGAAASSLKMCIKDINDNVIIWYTEEDEVSKTGNSYTFYFSDADRTAFRKCVTNGHSADIKYCIRTVVDGEIIENSVTRQFTLVEYIPTFNPTIYDVNENTIALTGDRNIIVNGQSEVYIDSGAEAPEGATIRSQKIECGSFWALYNPTYFNKVDGSEFKFTATDSRGNSSSTVVYKPFINYIPLSCNLEVDPIDSVREMTTLRITGNCFYGSFGAVDNTLTLQYRYRIDDGYADWNSVTVDIQDNNTYSFTISIYDLDYTRAYTFEAQAEDKLDAVSTREVKVHSIPVFDWGENDFNFNVPVTFGAGFNVPNRAAKQLWNGQSLMETSTTSINLIEPVSEQASGIVLIFTPFNNSTKVANDEKLMAFFIPKMAVFVRPSKMHTFMLTDGAKFNKIGAKSLYIGDAKISGYADNTANGTTNGITYDNTAFCLRYVLGV